MENDVYFAVYRKGKKDPLGTVGRDNIYSLLITLNQINPEGKYLAGLVSYEQAKEIQERAENNSFLEDLLR